MKGRSELEVIPAHADGMKLARVLSLAGVASRRKAEDLIRQGLVSVNGHRVTTPASRADPLRDQITYAGRPVQQGTLSARHHVLLNKPRGYVCTRNDESGRPTVLDLLPPGLRHLYPVGRLDINSEGLLLLTDDGDFCLKLTHPRYGKRKVYRVRVRGVPSAESLARLKRGIRTGGELLRADEVSLSRHGENSWLQIELTEGRRNELRRLLEAVGHRVVRLQRVAIEFLTLQGVPPGRYRPLREAEVRRLLSRSSRASARLRPGAIVPHPQESEGNPP